MARRTFDASAFQSRLDRLPALIKERVSAAIEADAKEWVSLAKTLAPKDTRALQESIISEATPTGGQIVQAGGPTTTREVRNGSGVGVDYAVMEEFGSQQAGQRPFFWVSYRTLKKKFKSRRSRALSKAIKELNT